MWKCRDPSSILCLLHLCKLAVDKKEYGETPAGDFHGVHDHSQVQGTLGNGVYRRVQGPVETVLVIS